MKQQYAETKTKEVTKGQIYMCMMCDKKFKTPDFVQKHIINKHGEELDLKFKSRRVEDMVKENYLNDPNRFTNSFVPFGSSGYRDRRGGGRSYREGHDDRGGERRRKEYVDYDDPKVNASKINPER